MALLSGILNKFLVAVSKINHLVSTFLYKFLASLPGTDESLVVVLGIFLIQVFGVVVGDSKQLSSSSVKNKSFGFNLAIPVFDTVFGH